MQNSVSDYMWHLVQPFKYFLVPFNYMPPTVSGHTKYTPHSSALKEFICVNKWFIIHMLKAIIANSQIVELM